MSFAEETIAAYRDDLKETIYIRRYTGSGANRPFFDTQTRADISGYKPEEMVGTIQQGDRKAIIFAPDLVDREFAFPISINDKLISRGREFSILSADHSTIREDDVLVAVIAQIRGQG